MIILEILAFVMLFTVIGGFVYEASGRFRKFYHDFLGWHRPAHNAIIKIEGPYAMSYCEFCGKKIIQDSNGDWF